MNDKPRPWQVLRRETIYDSPWVRLQRADVRLPDGKIINGHHLVDYPRPAVCVVPTRELSPALAYSGLMYASSSLKYS